LIWCNIVLVIYFIGYTFKSFRICKDKTITFEPTSICIIPAGVSYERNNLEEDILVIHFHMINYAMEEIQVFKVPDAQKYKELFTKALCLKYENGIGSTYRITSVVYEIFKSSLKIIL
jgi:hypothetical protein